MFIHFDPEMSFNLTIESNSREKLCPMHRVFIIELQKNQNHPKTLESKQERKGVLSKQ